MPINLSFYAVLSNKRPAPFPRLERSEVQTARLFFCSKGLDEEDLLHKKRTTVPFTKQYNAGWTIIGNLRRGL